MLNWLKRKIFGVQKFLNVKGLHLLHSVQEVVTETRNGMEQNGLFHPVLFWILRLEAIQYLSLNPKNFNLGIPNPKLKLLG